MLLKHTQLGTGRMRRLKTAVTFATLSFIVGCVQIPDGIAPVESFDAEQYLGTWYEIARLDHSFERGLTRVTAEYSRRSDGGIKVVNRGYNVEDETWESAEGKAYFVDAKNLGYLKVSFFGPFYGAYVIFELGEDYDYAYVAGNDKEYLWLLSRSPSVSKQRYQDFVKRAQSLGFPVEELQRIEHAAGN